MVINPYIFDSKPPNVVDLISYYRFNDDIVDSVGNNQLELSGSLEYLTGIIDKSARRNSANHSSKLRCVDVDSLTFVNGSIDSVFTINFLYQDEDYNFGTSLRKTLVSRQNQIEIGYASQGATVKPYVRLYSDIDNYIQVISSENIYKPNVSWCNLSFSYDASENEGGINIYFNGRKLNTVSESVGVYNGMTFQNVKTHLLTSQYSTQNATVVPVDEIQLWNRVLSQREVNSIYKWQLKGRPLPVIDPIPNPELYTENDACSIGANETESIGAGWIFEPNSLVTIENSTESNWCLKFNTLDNFDTVSRLQISGLEIGETYEISLDGRAEDATGLSAGRGFIRTDVNNGWASLAYADIDSFNWQHKSFSSVATDTDAILEYYPAFTDSAGVQVGWSGFLDNISIKKIS